MYSPRNNKMCEGISGFCFSGAVEVFVLQDVTFASLGDILTLKDEPSKLCPNMGHKILC